MISRSLIPARDRRAVEDCPQRVLALDGQICTSRHCAEVSPEQCELQLEPREPSSLLSPLHLPPLLSPPRMLFRCRKPECHHLEPFLKKTFLDTHFRVQHQTKIRLRDGRSGPAPSLCLSPLPAPSLMLTSLTCQTLSVVRQPDSTWPCPNSHLPSLCLPSTTALHKHLKGCSLSSPTGPPPSELDTAAPAPDRLPSQEDLAGFEGTARLSDDEEREGASSRDKGKGREVCREDEDQLDEQETSWDERESAGLAAGESMLCFVLGFVSSEPS
jgi:hypothetical protein